MYHLVMWPRDAGAFTVSTQSASAGRPLSAASAGTDAIVYCSTVGDGTPLPRGAEPVPINDVSINRTETGRKGLAGPYWRWPL